jgi:hypothetical protein
VRGQGRTWIKRAEIVDSRDSVRDIKFAPHHMGLKLATCSADGFMYGAQHSPRFAPCSRSCANGVVSPQLTGLMRTQPNLRGHGHHEPQPLVAHRRIRVSQGVRSSSLSHTLSRCPPFCVPRFVETLSPI